MRAFLNTSKNALAARVPSVRLAHLRQGRTQFSLIAGLALLLSIGFAVSNSLADDPMNPTLGTPTIDPFQCHRHEIDPGSGLFQFTIAGTLVNCEQLAGRTIELTGGPFTATTTTNDYGAFTVTFVMQYADGVGHTVVAVMEENGQELSDTVSLNVQ